MLSRVTITGADDSVTVAQLVDLSIEFPFVEWGVLVSKKQEGSCRFPSRQWIDRLVYASRGHMALSTHVCGRWVRQMLKGDLDFGELPSIVEASQRIQINTHGDSHDYTIAALKSLAAAGPVQFIFQLDGVNDRLALMADLNGVNAAGLWDTSAGAGRLPFSWHPPVKEIPCGYAGGLGPENVVEQVRKIEKVCDKPYWIDMERRVRSEDDSKLDMGKVRRVLEVCAPLVTYETRTANLLP